jgi:phosphoserine phosphatase RsbU/P
MLDVMYTVYRQQFAAVAAAWLDAGAHSLSLWHGPRFVAGWPDRAACSRGDPALVAGILNADNRYLGELRVTGLSGTTAQDRLAADAALLSCLARAEADLDGMTAELVDAQDQMLAMYDLARSTRAHLDVEGTLLSVAQEAARLARTAGAFTMLCIEPPDGPVQLALAPASLPVQREELAALLRRVQAKGSRLLLNTGDMSGMLPPGLSNLVLEPIEVSRKVLAGVGLAGKPGGDFTSPDLKLLQAIAAQAGAQIENVLLHQEVVAQTRLQTEMEVARNVQLRLLPQTAPTAPGIEFYGYSRPALQVGGDFFEFVSRPSWPVTFAVGDISGKGMSAALLMTMIHTVLRNHARLRPGTLPERILAQTNEDLYDDFSDIGAFATVFAGQFNAATRELSYANAGHSPVILYRAAGGQACLLEADGPPVGVLPISLAQNHVLTFAPGDVLVVATDGFSEARGADDEMFGYDRLLEMVEALAPLPSHEIAARMFEVISSFAAGHPQDDDQTLVVAKGMHL